MEVVRSDGSRLTLGPVRHEGGEGSIHDYPLDRQYLVKLYKQPTRERSEKLHALIAAQTPQVVGFAAWPMEAVCAPASSTAVGFIMRNSPGRLIHSIYSPKERKRDFPALGWDNLAHVAANAAAAFNSLHSACIVVGDVNEGNFLVRDDGKVCLIDCDSFQVTKNGQVYRCPVGVSTWTPPELQGISFQTIDRSPNHDLFGLAVMIFHLLFIGRHPFAGRRTGELSLEEAIKEFRFSYSPALASLGENPPPQSLPIGAVGNDLFQLFEQAFLAGSPYGKAVLTCSNCESRNRMDRNQTSTEPRCGRCGTFFAKDWRTIRPSAYEWHQALQTFRTSLTTCSADPIHKHLRGTPCPFCNLERTGFFAFVPKIQAAFNATTASMDRVWQAIQTFQLPAISLSQISLSPVTPNNLPQGLGNLNPWWVWGWIVIAASILCVFFGYPGAFVIGLIVGTMFLASGRRGPEFGKEKEERRLKTTKAAQAIESIKGRLGPIREELNNAARQAKRSAESAYTILRALPQEYVEEMKKLEQHKKAILIDQYLDTRLISERKFEGVGPKTLSSLYSYGVETALDVLNARWKPAKLRKASWEAMRSWALGISKNYVPDLRQAVPQVEIAKVQQRLQLKRTEAQTTLGNALTQLEVSARTAQEKASNLTKEYKAALQTQAQTEADFQLIDSIK